MTRFVAVLVFAWFMVALPARAEVLVYGGNLQRFSSGDDPALQKRKAFVVVDQDHGKIVTVKFDQTRTVEENGAGSTVDAAIAHVVGFLESKGYVLGP